MFERLLDPLLPWAARRAKLVLASALALAVLAALALPRLQVDTDVLHLLPRNGPATQAFTQYLAEFGSLDRVYVMFESPDERPIGEFSAAIGAYAERVRALREVRRVDVGLFGGARDWSYLADRQLLLFEGDALDAAVDRFRPEGMRRSLEQSRALLTLPSVDLKQLVRQDPLGLSRLLRERLAAGLTLPVDPAEEGLVSRDGRRRLIVVEPTDPPFDTAFSKRLLAGLAAAEADQHAAIQTPVEDGGEGDATAPPRTSYAGGYRVAVETEALVRRETIRNTAQSFVAVLILLALGLRSARLVLFGAVPIGLASMLVLAAAATAHVKLSAAASGSSAMLFGLGVDAVILMSLRYREEEASGTTLAIARMREPAASIILGVVTTAAAFLALLVMDFPALQEMGALVGGGILLCGALTIVVIPALLSSWPPAPLPRALSGRSIASFVVASRRAILWGAALLTLLLVPGIPRVKLVATLEKLRPATAASGTERIIAEHFGVTQDVYLALAEGPRLEPLLADHERLAARLRDEAPGIRVQTPAALLPSAAVQDARARRLEDARLDPTRVRADLARAAAAVGFRPNAFADFDERIGRVLDPTDRLTYDGFRAHGLEDVVAPLVRATRAGYSTVTYAFPATAVEAQAVERAVRSAGGALVLTGTPVVNRELESRFWPQFRTACALGGLLVVLLIAVSFRDLGSTLAALVPTGAGLVWALGLIGYLGIELDLFSAFGILTFLGIGVDYGIHVVHRWRASADVAAVVEHLGPALLLAGGTTLAGFGTLAFSTYAPLRSLGIVLFAMVAGALIASLTVLPVLLRGRTP